MGIFKSVGGDVQRGNFPWEIHHGGLISGNFPGGSFPDTVFRALSYIYDGDFFENIYWFLDANYSLQKSSVIGV